MATCSTSQATAVAAPARCAQIDRLREEARHLHEKLRLSRQQVRQHEKQDRRQNGSRSSQANDYELFLQRKILRNSLQIARHIADHGCEPLSHDRD